MNPNFVDTGGPGTGALNGPPIQQHYKRAVYRAAPREFLVEVLPPTKFGNGYCYGLRIDPILTGDMRSDDDSSGKSGSSRSTSQYEVWRRWEDCLWFQEILEEEYALMARNKRRGLAAGKGVKKNGVYIHSDGAASFDSLPPGPEANSIAKDVHEIVPKLSKKGTLFRPSQSTIEQRGREFKAMIESLWADDVPTLLRDLRHERIIRDFFAYWRRDKDLQRKSQGSIDGSRLSIASTFHFSASTTSLSPPYRYTPSPAPSTATSTTIRAPSAAPSAQSKGKAPMYRHSDMSFSASNLSRESSSSSSSCSHPAPMSFSVSARGSLRIDDLNSEEIRSRYSSLRGSMLSRSMSTRTTTQSSPILADGMNEFPFIMPGDVRHAALQALPEDQELVSDVETLPIHPRDVPPPVRRGRTNSCPKPNRANRNGLVFSTTSTIMGTLPGSPASEHSIPHSLYGEVESAWTPGRIKGDTSTTTLAFESLADSSRPTSLAYSTFTMESPPSSWRMSMASETSVATAMTELSSVLGESFVDMDCDARSSHSPNSPTSSMFDGKNPSMQSFMESWSPPHQHSQLRPTHAPRASVVTMNSVISGTSVDAVLPRGDLRSLSAGNGQRRRSFARSLERDSAYGYDIPDDVNYESADDVLSDYFYDESQGSTTPPRTPPPSQDAHRAHGEPIHVVTTPDRYPKAFQDRPPGQFHLPWSPPGSPPAATSPTGAESYTLKVMLQESIVLIRAAYGTPLADVRERIREKFANQEEIPLSSSFLIGYVSPGVAAKLGANGRARSASLSSSQDRTRSLHYIHSEEEWHTIVASCAGKLAIRVLDTHH